MTYDVFSGTLNLAQSINQSIQDLLADGEGPAALPLPQNPTSHRPFGPRHRCAHNFEILATLLMIMETNGDLCIRCISLQLVIHEAVMLLKERCRDTGDDVAASRVSRAAALRFIESVSNTKSFSRPSYINVTFESQQHRC